jgi:hypothetical protein
VDDEPQACYIVHALLGDEEEQGPRSGTRPNFVSPAF